MSGAGSPLYPQGTLRKGSVRDGVFRITPASAGNTPDPTGSPSSFEDHPCIRREHTDFLVLLFDVIGSPLHPQGTRCHGSKKKLEHGITPASAGNTS